MAFEDLNSMRRINDEEKSGDMFEDMKVSPALMAILSRIDPALSQPQALYICPRRELAIKDGLRDDSVKIMKEFGKCNPNFQLRTPTSGLLKERLCWKWLARKTKTRLKTSTLCQILSFLPTKIAASTSVLSRRWRYLLASVHNLDFDDSIYLHPKKRDMPWRMASSSFVAFVDRVLALQSKFALEKFSLKTADFYYPNHIICWIHKVLARGVSDLHLGVGVWTNQ